MQGVGGAASRRDTLLSAMAA
eukprot:SAG11_NODE_8710_length_985_cov_0.955982_1_plen_20_part_10